MDTSRRSGVPGFCPRVRRVLPRIVVLALLLGVAAVPAGGTVPPPPHRPSAPACTRPSFEVGGPLPLSTGGAAIADFDGDGNLDIAFGGLGITVLRGDGEGNFAAGISTLSDQVFTVLAAGDFDQDGKPDLLALDAYGLTLILLLGDGAGGFSVGPAPPEPYFGGQPVGAVIADFNGDGHLDAAVLSIVSYEGVAWVLLGDGTGHFALPPSSANAGFFAAAPVLGDFDGNGVPDLAVVNSAGVEVLLSDGAGGFSSTSQWPAGSKPASIAVGDFDENGTADLAVANAQSNDVSILLGDGSGNFSAGATLPAGSRADFIGAADWNSDGHLDLAVANDLSGDLIVYLGDGHGAFAARSVKYNATRPGTLMALADFTRDGIPDILFSAAVASAVFVGDGAGGFRTSRIYPTGGDPSGIVAGDFDGDGKIDLATANGFSGGVSVLRGDGTGAFAAPVQSAAGTLSLALAAGDFDRDGVLDLAVTNFTANTVSVLRGVGGGHFAAPVTYAVGASPTAVAAADVNGDGRLDLVVANRDGGTVSVLLGDGAGGFGLQATFVSGGGPEDVAVADFDGDGFVDIAVANDGDSSLSILFGTGNGSFGSRADVLAGPYGRRLAVGDFNGDGAPDIALAHNEATVMVLLNDGSGHFAPGPTYLIGQFIGDVAVGDFDGDGLLDFAATNTDYGNFGIFLGDGAGGFTPGFGYGSGGGPLSLAVADLDGDGRPDLAIGAAGAGGATILRNTSFVVLPEHLPAATVTVPYGAQLASAGGSGGAVFALTGSLPDGISFDPGTARLSGTPSVAGTFRFSVSATDGSACATTRAYALVVGMVDTSLSMSLTPAVPLGGQPLTLRVTVTTVPPGLGTPTGTVTFVIDGVAQTPVPVVDGVASLTVRGLTPGPHTIGASYSGGGVFGAAALAASGTTVLATAIPTLGVRALLALAALLGLVGMGLARRPF